MRRFTLTGEHITLLRASYVVWECGEFGAASINCKRPYGNSSVYEDIAKLLHIEPCIEYGQPGPGAFNDSDRQRMDVLHAATSTALQVVLAVGEFMPGEYEASDYGIGWRRREG